jgi:disulfide bond formation protein DsbB
MAEAAIGSGAATRRDVPLIPARLLALLLPSALLLAAFGSEHIGGLVPCEMCWWQRYPHMVAVLLAASAFTAPESAARARLLTTFAALAIAVSGAIGVYHAGVELKIFEGITTCTSLASGASNEELLKSIMNAPIVRCDQIQWSFLGISMAGWNALVSLTGAAAILWLLRRELRA